MLAACEGFPERMQLYLLLMLNCGMYQNDIAELRSDEVHWKAGTLTRARSKTRERGGPVVTYKLWPETFALLKKHRGEGVWRSPQTKATRWSGTGWKTGRCVATTRSSPPGHAWWAEWTER